MCKPLPLSRFENDPVFAYLASLKAQRAAGETFRTNAFRLEAEHAAEVSAIETEAFARTGRKLRLVVDNTK